jgi:hypothetical protein
VKDLVFFFEEATDWNKQTGRDERTEENLQSNAQVNVLFWSKIQCLSKARRLDMCTHITELTAS